MDIDKIIEKHYDDLTKYVRGDKAISLGKTEEDLLNEACISALNKYRGKDITEDEGFEYLKRTLFYAKQYQHNKKCYDLLICVDNVMPIMNTEEDSQE